MKCPNGHENPDHYHYCGECGARITAANPGALIETFGEPAATATTRAPTTKSDMTVSVWQRHGQSQHPRERVAPLSYLTDLFDWVSKPDILNHEQQRYVLSRIEPAIRSVELEEQQRASDILEMLSSREELYADVARTIARLRSLTDMHVGVHSREADTVRAPATTGATAPSPLTEDTIREPKATGATPGRIPAAPTISSGDVPTQRAPSVPNDRVASHRSTDSTVASQQQPTERAQMSVPGSKRTARRPRTITAAAVIAFLYAAVLLSAAIAGISDAARGAGSLPPGLYYLHAVVDLVLAPLLVWGGIGAMKGSTKKVLLFAAWAMGAVFALWMIIGGSLAPGPGTYIAGEVIGILLFALIFPVPINLLLMTRSSRDFFTARGGGKA